MEESENGRIGLSEPCPSFWPRKPTTLTLAFFLFTPVFLCPSAVLLSPSPSLFQSHLCSQSLCLQALVHGVSAWAALFHIISRRTVPAGCMLSWKEDGAGRRCGDAIACQEPCSQRKKFTKVARRSFLGCGDWQVSGRRDRCVNLGKAVARRGWDGVLWSVWEHCAGWQWGGDVYGVRDLVWGMRRGCSAGPSGRLAWWWSSADGQAGRGSSCWMSYAKHN